MLSLIVNVRPEKSGWPKMAAMSGVIRSSTRDVTRAVSASASTKATATSMRLPLRRKSLNSLSIAYLRLGWRADDTPVPRPGLGALLDWHVDQIPPLGPGAVVVPYVLVAEQLAEHEPGVSAPLADTAVGRHGHVRTHALGRVELAELFGRLERPVVAHGARPRDRRGRGDVTRPLRSLLLVAGRGDQLARVLGRRTHVDEGDVASADPLAYLVPVCADRLVALLRPVLARFRRGYVGHELAPLVDPLLPPAVEDPHVGVAVHLQIPVGVRGEPVVFVPVEDNRRFRADAEPAEQLLERLPVDDVSFDRILEVVPPVELHCSRDVPLLVEIWVLVHLRDDEPLVVQMLGQPLGRDQHRLRIAVVRHAASSESSLQKVKRKYTRLGYSRAMPRLTELMSRDVIGIAPEDTLGEAAERMAGSDVGSAVVLEHGRLIGILTERDVLRAVAGRVHSSEARVREWMTADPVTASGETTHAQALETMMEHGFRHLPVVDGERTLGIVSIRDVTRAELQSSGTRPEGSESA